MFLTDALELWHEEEFSGAMSLDNTRSTSYKGLTDVQAGAAMCASLQCPYKSRKRGEQAIEGAD